MKSENEGSFFFFGKHFNDIDHTVPVIFALLKNGVPAKRIRYICTNPMFTGIRQDPRLKLLETKGVIFEIPANIILARIHKLIRRFYPTTPTRKILPFQFQVIFKILRSISPLFTDLEKANACIKEKLGKIVADAPDRSLFIFHTGAGALNSFIVRECKKRGFPSACLPHGIVLFSVGPGEGENDCVDLNIFDAVVAPNNLYGDRMVRLGLSSAKKRVLGTPRFSTEWMEITKELYPTPENLKGNASQLKVLYIVGKYDEPVDLQVATIDFLNREEGVTPIVKLNTRGIKTAQYKAFKKLKSHYADAQYTTQELISWADVILTGGSSVLMDPVMRGKTVITMEYINSINYVFDEYRVPWNVKTLCELKSAVRILKKEPGYRAYTEKDIELFVNEFVFSGEDSPVLPRYSHFLTSLLDSSSEEKSALPTSRISV